MFKPLVLLTLMIATSSGGWVFESCVWRPTLACGGGALGCGIEGRVQVGTAARSKEDAAVFWTKLKKSQDVRGNLDSFGTPCYGADDGSFGPNGKRFCCCSSSLQ